jgi:hypothetical protein
MYRAAQARNVGGGVRAFDAREAIGRLVLVIH